MIYTYNWDGEAHLGDRIHLAWWARLLQDRGDSLVVLGEGDARVDWLCSVYGTSVGWDVEAEGESFDGFGLVREHGVPRPVTYSWTPTHPTAQLIGRDNGRIIPRSHRERYYGDRWRVDDWTDPLPEFFSRLALSSNHVSVSSATLWWCASLSIPCTMYVLNVKWWRSHCPYTAVAQHIKNIDVQFLDLRPDDSQFDEMRLAKVVAQDQQYLKK